VTLLPLAQHSVHVYEADARRTSDALGLDLVCVRPWGQDPGLCSAFAGRIVAALGSIEDRSRTTVLMTAHSLPEAVIASGDPYELDVRAAAEAIAARVKGRVGNVEHALAFQSQGLGGRTPDGRDIAWLGPDLGASLDDVAARGDRWVVLAPIGFLADHVEILYDLDIEARAMAEDRGLTYARTASLNADDDLVEVLAKIARPLLGEALGDDQADG
jgi:ferrochelatase